MTSIDTGNETAGTDRFAPQTKAQSSTRVCCESVPPPPPWTSGFGALGRPEPERKNRRDKNRGDEWERLILAAILAVVVSVLILK